MSRLLPELITARIRRMGKVMFSHAGYPSPRFFPRPPRYPLSRIGLGSPHLGLGYPPARTGLGYPAWPGQDWGTPWSGPDWAHGGWYACCSHAGGLSCFQYISSKLQKQSASLKKLTAVAQQCLLVEYQLFVSVLLAAPLNISLVIVNSLWPRIGVFLNSQFPFVERTKWTKFWKASATDK